MEKPACVCPKCSKRFIPWSVWRITRWSCIACPSCGVKLNRRLDWIFAFLLIAGSILTPVVMAIAFSLRAHWLVSILLVLLFCALFWLIDVFTVRLVIAGDKRGIFGYKI